MIRTPVPNTDPTYLSLLQYVDPRLDKYFVIAQGVLSGAKALWGSYPSFRSSVQACRRANESGSFVGLAACYLQAAGKWFSLATSSGPPH